MRLQEREWHSQEPPLPPWCAVVGLGAQECDINQPINKPINLLY